MSDETELNIELSVEQQQVESALDRLTLPDGNIDQHALMYQAGWSAAVAAMAKNRKQTNLSQITARGKVWPVLTATLAVTTAACLAIMLFPPRVDEIARPDSAALSARAVTPVETLASENNLKSSSKSLVESTQKTGAQPHRRKPQRRFKNLIGFSSNSLITARESELNQLIAEAACPNDVNFLELHNDWDAESAAPLTPASIKSFF